ncbi:g7155 [Coccomyxa viridis]|uniref:G7155 protein n=1 Tax=Coccomyxa viridis TaxID=1274662 RepID=A0ABP1FZP0_9CHLO
MIIIACQLSPNGKFNGISEASAQKTVTAAMGTTVALQCLLVDQGQLLILQLPISVRNNWCTPFGPRRPVQCNASRSASTSTSGTQAGLGNPWLKAAITTGTLSLAGDLLAQGLIRRHQSRARATPQSFDAVRAARMGGYGFCFYGPYQHFWYGQLDKFFPTRSLAHFGSKVLLNQVALGPVILSSVLLWNFALTRQLEKLPNKMQRDFVPTLINGWKFWVPASVVNFWVVPLQYRVLWMSTCGLFWAGYLSYTSNA